MNEEHFVYVIGCAGKPLPISAQEYDTLREEQVNPSKNALHSITVDGRSTFSFRTSSVAMIERRSKA
jgi:hypothetical protein